MKFWKLMYLILRVILYIDQVDKITSKTICLNVENYFNYFFILYSGMLTCYWWKRLKKQKKNNTLNFKI